MPLDTLGATVLSIAARIHTGSVKSRCPLKIHWRAIWSAPEFYCVSNPGYVVYDRSLLVSSRNRQIQSLVSIGTIQTTTGYVCYPVNISF